MSDRGRMITIASAIAAALAIAGLLVIIAARDERPHPRPVESAPPPASTTVTVSVTPSVAPSSAPPTASTSAHKITLLVAGDAGGETDPEDDEGWKQYKPGQPLPGDFFEDDGDRPAIARKLTTVGDITLGVTKDAKVTDEAKVISILRRLGSEIDKLDRGRTDAPHKRLPEYTKVFRRYREELRQHMDGQFVLRGTGWNMGFEAGPGAEAEAKAEGRE